MAIRNTLPLFTVAKLKIAKKLALFVVTYAIAGVLFVMLPWIYIHRRHGEHLASQSVATSSGSE